jgi:seryl-tRNA synthetase
VPLTNLVRESIVSEDELPLRYTALTPCFRSEPVRRARHARHAAAAPVQQGRARFGHHAEQGLGEHERMTACAEEVLKGSILAYRVVLLSTGDMGFASQKTYDLEVWLPGQKAYREISSCSVCGDFQARRMKARFGATAGPSSSTPSTAPASPSAARLSP